MHFFREFHNLAADAVIWPNTVGMSAWKCTEYKSEWRNTIESEMLDAIAV